jgi:hypothetical protein
VVSLENELERRIAAAWVILHKMEAIWKTPDFSNWHIAHLFKSLVLEIFLYVCESWTLTVAQMRMIKGKYTRMIRFIKQIKVFNFESRISNELLMIGFPDIERTIVERIIKFASKCCTARQQQVTFILMYEPSHPGHYMSYTRMMRNYTGHTNAEILIALATDEGTDQLVKDAMLIITIKKYEEANKVRTEIQELGTGRGAKRKAIEELRPGSLDSRHRYDDKRISQLVCRVCKLKDCIEHCQRNLCCTKHREATFVPCVTCKRRTGTTCMKLDIKRNYNNTNIYLCEDCYKLKK